MTGRAELDSLKKRLDAAFERTRDVDQNIELQSDLARYLCVLVSGYIEKAVVAIVLEHARQRGKGAPTLQSFVAEKTKFFTNPKTSKILDLLGSFDPEWKRELKDFLVDEPKEAVNSIVALRNNIAHGGSDGLTYSRICDYYKQAQRVIDEVTKLCLPKG